MNAKTCKRLRKESRHHPADPRRYKKGPSGGLELDDAHPLTGRRVLYRELKKEERENANL